LAWRFLLQKRIEKVIDAAGDAAGETRRIFDKAGNATGQAGRGA
jgi:hypothetical protein